LSDAIAACAVELPKEPANHNSSVRFYSDSVYLRVGVERLHTQTRIKTRIQRAVIIQSGNATAAEAIKGGEISSEDDAPVRLNGH